MDIKLIKEIKQNKQGFCSISMTKDDLRKLGIDVEERVFNRYVVIKLVGDTNEPTI